MLRCEMSTADGQTFARDLRNSQGRQLLKPRIAVSKLKKVLREVASLPDGLTSPLVPWASSQRRLGWRSPAEVCDEVATLLCRGLYRQRETASMPAGAD